MKTLDELKRLQNVLEEPCLLRAKREWGGADVVITLYWFSVNWSNPVLK